MIRPCVLLTAVLSVAAQRRLFSVKPIEHVARDLGYDIERHNITTSDGYILTYHRIPRGWNMSRDSGAPLKRKVLLFINGIMLSSASVLTSRGDFAYTFADAGFDVWLGNYRGNMYSRRHTLMDPDSDDAFWDYSLHELGALDLPASIDYILDVTGSESLVYVGASMGTTMFWVLGASRPEYMAKVKAMVAIAPVARTSHAAVLNSPPRYNAALAAISTIHSLGFKEMFPYSETTSAVIYAACKRSWLRPLCHGMLDLYGLISGDHWDMERLLEATKYSPAGISTKVLLHYVQIAKARKFQQYDYGPRLNRQRYKTESPTEYNLKNVNCSSIFFVNSDADLLAAKEDVAWLSDQLPVRPTRILETVNHLGHFGLGLDKGISDLLVRPLADYLKERFL